MVTITGTILGIFPVVAEVNCGWSESTPYSDAEYYSEVEAIYWQRRDGSKGKEIPVHIWERAYEYDYMFCDLMESGFDELAYRDHQEKEMVQLEGEPGNAIPLACKPMVT